MVERHFVKQFKENDIQLSGILGEGSFGKVMGGILGNKTEVAIKRVKNILPEGHVPGIALNEINILAGIKHKNVVHLYGSFTYRNTPGINIILELLENGKLSTFVQSYQIPDEILLDISYDIACGMDYIHDMDILHMDLAARNILLDSNYRAKVSDFGLSKQMILHSGLPLHNRNYYRWMPKECLPMGNEIGHFSKSSDVWSFGITLWEMWSRRDLPYSALSTTEEVREAIIQGKNPISFENNNWDIFPSELGELIKRGIFQNEEDRLPFAEIKIQIKRLRSPSSDDSDEEYSSSDEEYFTS